MYLKTWSAGRCVGGAELEDLGIGATPQLQH